jgi:hypothetical protein
VYTRYAENDFSFDNLYFISATEKKACRRISYLFILYFIANLTLFILSADDYEFIAN